MNKETIDAAVAEETIASKLKGDPLRRKLLSVFVKAFKETFKLYKQPILKDYLPAQKVIELMRNAYLNFVAAVNTKEKEKRMRIMGIFFGFYMAAMEYFPLLNPSFPMKVRYTLGEPLILLNNTEEAEILLSNERIAKILQANNINTKFLKERMMALISKKQLTPEQENLMTKLIKQLG